MAPNNTRGLYFLAAVLALAALAFCGPARAGATDTFAQAGRSQPIDVPGAGPGSLALAKSPAPTAPARKPGAEATKAAVEYYVFLFLILALLLVVAGVIFSGLRGVRGYRTGRRRRFVGDAKLERQSYSCGGGSGSD